MPAIDFLCLANSSRPGGRCVAGLRLDGRGWVRPVPVPEGDALRASACQLPGGRQLELLQTVRVRVDKAVPTVVQPENWLITQEPWEDGPDVPAALGSFLRPHVRKGLLFETPGDSIDLESVKQSPPGYSLALLKLDKADLEVRTAYRGNWRGQIRFSKGGQTYDLPITDRNIAEQVRSLGLGSWSWADFGFRSDRPLYVTASLGDAFKGACYKIAAAVFQLS